MARTPQSAGPDSERLFTAGVAYICCEAWALAYDCFARCAREDAPTRYNQALCCFMVEWYEQSRRLLAEAELLLDGMSCEIPCTGVPPALRWQSPDAFRRWEAASELPHCPLLPGTPREDAFALILRLRAEAACRLGRYEELRTIAARLGHRYEHIEKLLKQIDI